MLAAGGDTNGGQQAAPCSAPCSPGLPLPAFPRCSPVRLSELRAAAPLSYNQYPDTDTLSQPRPVPALLPVLTLSHQAAPPYHRQLWRCGKCYQAGSPSPVITMCQ